MLAGILVATAVLYLPSMRNGWVCDDTLQIVDNAPLHSWAGIGKSFIYDSWWFLRSGQSSAKRLLSSAAGGLVLAELDDPGESPGRVASGKNRGRTDRGGAVLPARATADPQHDHWVTDRGNLRTPSRQRRGGSVGSAIGEPLSTIFEMGALCCLIKREAGMVARADLRVDAVRRRAAESRDSGPLLAGRRSICLF